MMTAIFIFFALAINSVLGFALGVLNSRVWENTRETKKDLTSVAIRYVFWPCTTTGHIMSPDGVSGMDYYSSLPPVNDQLDFDTIKVMSVIGPLPKIAFNTVFICLTGAMIITLYTLSLVISTIGKLGSFLVDFFSKAFKIELKNSDDYWS